MLLGLGAGHAFKFAPTFGRLLADLAVDGATTSDISAFAPDRPALVEQPAIRPWLVWCDRVRRAGRRRSMPSSAAAAPAYPRGHLAAA